MTPRRVVVVFCLSALALLCAGCATARPAHLTIFCERDEAEATSAGSRQRTTTDKTGASLTFELP